MLGIMPKMIDGMDVADIIPKFMATLLRCGDKENDGLLGIMS